MMSEAPSVQNRPRVVGKAAGDAKRAAISCRGPTLPTCAVQPFGGYLGYTGRGANEVPEAAHNPGCVKTLTLCWKVEIAF